jgi:hypothetical protein
VKSPIPMLEIKLHGAFILLIIWKSCREFCWKV